MTMGHLPNYVSMEKGSDASQMIDGDGNFHGETLEHFMKSTRFDQCHLSYAVVAIMGPQSSGKSTLLNKLFGTRFVEMDALRGRNQTTKGIWIAKCAGIEPPTIVMDVEGTDGKERGQNDATFEKQTTLFALTTADILLINMWCHDIGREHGANKPLLRTVFQAMLQLFSPRKTTLLFVLRDKSKSPLEILKEQLSEQIQEIWNSVPKPDEFENTLIDHFFNVVVVALSHYEMMQERFLEEVNELRRQFMSSIVPGGLAGDRRLVPASAFSINVKEIWKTIKENKNLDFPAHQVLVATYRCDQIANDMLREFIKDEDLDVLLNDASQGKVTQAGARLQTILDKYLAAYDKEASFFDVHVKNNKRQLLDAKLLEYVSTHFTKIVQNVASQALNNFETKMKLCLDEGKGFNEAGSSCKEACIIEFVSVCEDAALEHANWDSSIREKLLCEINAHESRLRNSMLGELVAKYENKLDEAIVGASGILLSSGKTNTWDLLRNLIVLETNVVAKDFLLDASRFEMNQDDLNIALEGFKDYARGLVEKEAKSEARRVSTHMKNRFLTVVNSCTGDVNDLIRKAQMASLKLLSIIAAIRWEDKQDEIRNILVSSLLDNSRQHSLTSRTWGEVSQEATIIEPVQCVSVWKEFMKKVKPRIQEAQERMKNDEHAGFGEVLGTIWRTVLDPHTTLKALKELSRRRDNQ